MENFKAFAGFGIAGNFALHLEQAGEIEDFKDLEVADENGPKGIFPFYMPGFETQIGVFPLSSDTIKLPEDASLNVQAEPEVALECTLKYENGKVAAVIPERFAPYNDCSIRRPGAKKISEKKNWGAMTKGLGAKMFPVDTFAEGGIMDNWHIASFLRRDGELHRYGEDAALVGYSYFHGKLMDWIAGQLNTQEDTGPLEPVLAYLEKAGYPEKMIISIGATRYTEYGETTFLNEGDEVIVVLYDAEILDPNTVMQSIDAGVYDANGMSVLSQKVTGA
ncbi:MAG: DUF5718 family protein [Campylobacterales bacterium]|jgi:hypothetical protein